MPKPQVFVSYGRRSDPTRALLAELEPELEKVGAHLLKDVRIWDAVRAREPFAGLARYQGQAEAEALRPRLVRASGRGSWTRSSRSRRSMPRTR